MTDNYKKILADYFKKNKIDFELINVNDNNRNITLNGFLVNSPFTKSNKIFLFFINEKAYIKVFTNSDYETCFNDREMGEHEYKDIFVLIDCLNLYYRNYLIKYD